MFPDTVIIRHKRENLKKCSLRGLENDPGLAFYSYPHQICPPVAGYLMLSLEGPPLCKEDSDRGLLLLDSTWRYLPAMSKWVESYHTLERRSLPTDLRTAYPRRQEDCADPERGLATVEALYYCHRLLGRPYADLLRYYHWRDDFITLNQDLFSES